MTEQQTMKRRGILAAAGAVVAGIMANSTSQAVRATSGTGTQGNLVLASNTVDNSANTASRPTYLLNTAGGTPTVGSFAASDAFVAASLSGVGVKGQSSSGVGLDGLSSTFHGVIGQTGTGSGHAGIAGFGAGTNTLGVIGDGAGGGGSTDGAVGVQGQNAQYGVVGKITGGANTVAVFGNNQSTGSDPLGVWGFSTSGTGVFGQTGAINQYGVLGTTTATSSTAVGGIANANGAVAFGGGTSNPNAYAGYFQGTVVVQGNFAVTGNKSAVIQHPRTGDHRLVYCVESPEAWFEDFGKAQLSAGKASVTLDADFAALIHADDYHVFLTEYGETNGLYVSGQTASGFAVQERNGGTHSGRFSWRVVAKRADVKAERLGKFVMPTLPLPDPEKYKAPDLPTAVPPAKKA